MRTVIVYHKDGTRTEYTGAAARGIVARPKNEDKAEKVNYHKKILDTCRELEIEGKTTFTRREAEVYKTVHTAAMEYGGDLPPSKR